MRVDPRLELAPLGDGALRWRRDALEAERGDARTLLDALRAHPGVIDAIVTEEHACVTFDPAHPPEAPWTVSARPAHGAARAVPREWTVRVRYDGPDLAEVAERCALGADDVVRLHSARAYAVRLVGFLPGFAYLGPLDPALVLPRRATPRPRIAAGSIGIAAGYTGIYPSPAPGGWSLIGHALDFTAFGPRGATLALGDRVRFEPAR